MNNKITKFISGSYKCLFADETIKHGLLILIFMLLSLCTYGRTAAKLDLERVPWHSLTTNEFLVSTLADETESVSSTKRNKTIITTSNLNLGTVNSTIPYTFKNARSSKNIVHTINDHAHSESTLSAGRNTAVASGTLNSVYPIKQQLSSIFLSPSVSDLANYSLVSTKD